MAAVRNIPPYDRHCRLRIDSMSSRAKKPGSQSRAKWQSMSEELSEELGLAAKRLQANGEARGDLQSAVKGYMARRGAHRINARRRQ